MLKINKMNSVAEPQANVIKLSQEIGSEPAESDKFNELADNLATMVLDGAQDKPDKFQTLLDNGYSYGEKLGEGAFSEVLKGLSGSKDVAIKIINKSKIDQSQQQLALKEVTILRKLKHKNIVGFEGFFEDANYYYIVQELCSGGEVFNQIVHWTYFSEDLARHVICQIAEAIKYLHNEIGIVHRDLKPENILFEPIDFLKSSKIRLRGSDDPRTKKDEGQFVYGVGGGEIGTVKLADFGLSKQIWENNTKTPCGTVGYTAPEIVKDEKYSKQVDMWGLGCVLYTLLCGFPPFYDENIEELTTKISKGQFEFLKPWWDEISQGAKNCVLRLLCVNVKQRYDINEFFQDPWIREFLAKVPKDASGNYSYSSKKKVLVKRGGYSASLASPAAIVLKDAFDVSTALHRDNEERHMREHISTLAEVDEEDESYSEKFDFAPEKFFELNMKDSSILQRRK